MGRKKCQAQTTTGKKCKLFPAPKSEYCRIHVDYTPDNQTSRPCENQEMIVCTSLKIAEQTSPCILPSNEDGIYVPKDIWNPIFDHLHIMDIRSMGMVCRFMKTYSRSYWNETGSIPDRQRYYAMASIETGLILKGKDDTSYCLIDDKLVLDKYNRQSHDRWICDGLPVIVDTTNEDGSIMAWKKSDVKIYEYELFHLYTCIRDYKSFLAFCKKLREEDKMIAEFIGSTPESIRKEITTNFATSLAVKQIYNEINNDSNLYVTLFGTNTPITDHTDILDLVKAELKKKDPEIMFLLLESGAIVKHHKPTIL